MGLDGVAEHGLAVHGIGVFSPDFHPAENVRSFEVGYDSLNGAFRNADAQCDFSQCEIGLFRQENDDVCVVREKCPSANSGRGWGFFFHSDA